MASTIKKIAVLTVAATLLTSCGSGQTAATRAIKQVTDGVEAQSNEVRLRNIKIVKNNLSQGILVGTLVNWSESSDALVGISIDGVPAQLSAPSFDLLRNKPITFVGESANADAYAQISKAAGERIPVTFTFATAKPITVDALVVANDGIYANLLRTETTVATVELDKVNP
jgi:copper(I)-binding protein